MADEPLHPQIAVKTAPRAAVGLAILLFVMLLTPLPQCGREIQAFLDLLHAPAFALMAVFLSRAIRRPARYLKALIWVSLAATALLTETAQGVVGRIPSRTDALANMVGAIVGIIWVQGSVSASLWERRRRAVICIVLILGVSVTPILVLVDSALQRLEFPRLASFERSIELTRWTTKHCDLRRTRRHVTHGSWALRVDFRPAQYPGASMRWPVPDWSDYAELAFDISLDDGPPLDVIVKIEDADHNQHYSDRFHRRLRISPGTNQFRILLADVAEASRGRQMDVRKIRLIQFFSINLKAGRTLFLDNVHLK